MKNSFCKFWCGVWHDKAKRLLVIGLALIILGGFLACLIQTDFFRVKIYTAEIAVGPDSLVTSKAKALRAQTGVDGWSIADIYMPKDASAENKVPLIMVAPGINRTRETQASFCIELVRRGYAVICIDPFGQGESSPSYEAQSATNEGYGLFNWLDYMYTEEGMAEFDWVDYSRIGACGHSAGGNACQKLAEREGKLATMNRTASRIQGVYITGYIREWTWSSSTCNIGLSYSINDEGAFQNQTHKNKLAAQAKLDAGGTLSEKEAAWLETGDSDCRYAPEAIAIVNFQLNREGVAPVDEVIIGEQYGNQYAQDSFGNAAGTYCIINNETALHAFQPYDKLTISHLSNFFNTTMEHETALPDGNQVWWFREIGCGAALVGGFMLVLALLELLLRTKAFSSLRKPVPARTAAQGKRGTVIFWITFAVSATIACFLYMACVKLSVSWFPEASSGTQTWMFPQRFTNAVMMWAVANGLIGMALFALTTGVEYLLDKKAGKTDVALLKASYLQKLEPLKVGGLRDALKTIALGAILVCAFYGMDYLCYIVFHADFRFMFLSARVSFQPRAIASIAMYIPFFFIFYFSNSLRVNCSMRPANWSEPLSQVIAVLGNTLGLIAILFIQYIPFVSTGTVGYVSTVGPQWLFVNLLFGIIPMMAILPLANRYFFNKTGRAWLGPMVTCAIFIAMSGGCTTIYYLL